MEYKDVRSSHDDLERMLELNGGVRKVPTVIEADGKVQIGHGGT